MGHTTALLLGQLDGVILVSYIQVSTRTCGRISSTRTELAIGYLLVKLFGGISIASKLLLILGKTLCSVLSFLEIWARKLMRSIFLLGFLKLALVLFAQAQIDGSNEYNDFVRGSINTTYQLVKDLKNIDMVMHIGDICYANGYLSQWVQFTAQVDPIASTVPYMVASGNHERDWPGSGSFYGNIDSGSECGVPAQNMFYVPAENREQFWYFTDYGMFRYSVANTELDWRPGTEQYKFIEHCFSSVDRQKQPWLIFLVHLVLGYSSATFYGDSCNESCDLQASRV